jgi:hypothetical protein
MLDLAVPQLWWTDRSCQLSSNTIFLLFLCNLIAHYVPVRCFLSHIAIILVLKRILIQKIFHSWHQSCRLSKLPLNNLGVSVGDFRPKLAGWVSATATATGLRVLISTYRHRIVLLLLLFLKLKLLLSYTNFDILLSLPVAFTLFRETTWCSISMLVCVFRFTTTRKTTKH